MVATAQEVYAVLQGYGGVDSPRMLNWQTDFRSVTPSPNPPFNAQTQTTFSASWGSVRLDNGVYRLSNVRVRVDIVRLGTWVDSSWLNSAAQADKDWLLLHEQGHFDIIGAIARDLCRGLLSLELDDTLVAAVYLPANTRDTARNRMSAANDYFRRETAKLSDEAAALRRRLENRVERGAEIEGQYERETNHGQNRPEQTTWNDIFFFARERDCSLPLSLILHNK